MPSTSRLSRYRTIVLHDAATGIVAVTYIRTRIVHASPAGIVLNSGGYRTVTTKRKMCQTAAEFGLNFSVFQKNHEWFVRDGVTGQTHEFFDGITLAR